MIGDTKILYSNSVQNHLKLAMSTKLLLLNCWCTQTSPLANCEFIALIL